MKLMFIRHGRATERSLLTLTSKRDQARPLTDAGRKDMRKAARGLRKVAPDIDVLASSALFRARQTAEIVQRVFGCKEILTVAPLAPGSAPEKLLAWLDTQPEDATIALVGHEPDFSRTTAWLLTESASSFFSYKKGGTSLVEFEGRAAPGRGQLVWLMTPGQLRRLG
jgi:phosphohistidine phosphatase